MIPLLFVLSVVVPATVQSASCPPLQFPTVLAECQFEGRPLDCARRPSPPGTRATFRCRPQHVVRAGYMRLSSYEVLCGPRGEWGDGPFRCVPTQPPEPSVGAAPAPASCPPLRSRTVLAECRLAGQPVDCMSRPALPGTVAKFRCRPLHEFLFGYLPAAGFESRCSSAGDWSVQPFRCVPICGQPTGRGVEFIRNGNMSTSAADFPWHVTVYDKATPKNVKQICGGTLISTKYFVSAAHCFHNGKTAFPASRYVAGFGKVKRSANDTEPTEQFRETSKIFTNGYKGARELHSNDIALVELKEDVDITSWTMPVCVDWGLELPDLQHGEKGAVVGFGGERPTKELHFALLPFAKSDECRKNVSDVLAVFNKLKDKFCIGFVNRTQVSKGDSGGGIAFPSTDRVWFLRGVVSIGDSARTTYSFFTNVTHYVPWMAGIIQRGEVTGRRCGIGGSQSEGSEIHDFPWDVDVFYKQTSSRHPERLQTGALIRPNLAITQSRTVSSTGQPVDLSEYPAAWLWVTPSRNITSIPNPEMTGNVSEVVRVFFPGDVLAASGRLYNLVLLELRQPLQLMPVCLDWTGTTLLQGQHGTGIVDIGQAGRKRWTSLSLLDAARCKQSIAPESHHVCAFHEGKQSKVVQEP